MRPFLVLTLACALLLPLPATAQSPPAPTAPAAKPEYKDRLSAIKQRLEKLQDRLKTAGDRIQALRDYMVKNVNPAARLIVRFDDRMGSSFTPLSLIVSLDGKEIASYTLAQKNLNKGGKHVLFNQDVPIGTKTVQVRASYKGAGGMPYMKDFAYKLNRKHKFSAKGGRITTLITYGYQRGDATFDPSQRPWIGFDVNAIEYTRANLNSVTPVIKPPPKKKGPKATPAKTGKTAKATPKPAAKPAPTAKSP